MRHSPAITVFMFIISLALPATASDYNGWYLGFGIGYGYPLQTAPVSACTDAGGKIINAQGKVFCSKPVNGQNHSAKPQHINGQRTGFMWQGMQQQPGSSNKNDKNTAAPSPAGH